MTDIQTLDLMSSYRRRTQLAMALSFALRYKGLGAQAEAFDRYVKQREKDVFTRTAEVPVTAYSNGNMFGYQVGPVLRGIGDPTAKKPKPQYRLSRQAFPVLIICGLDREDLAPYLVTLQGGYASNSLRLQVVEPYLQFTQTPRWIPLTKKASKHRLSEKRILGWSHGLFQETLNARGASPLHLGSGTLKLAEYRIKKLKNHAFGSYARQSLPVGLIKARTRCPAVPLVRRVLPGKVLISRNAKGKPQEKRVTLTLLGDHLNQVDPSKIISILGTTEVVGEGTFVGGALQVEVKIKDGEAPVVLSLELKREAKEKHAPMILSLPVMVGYETLPGPPKPTVIRYTKKTGDEKVEHEVNISPGAGDTAIKSSESILKSGM
jgi:hypothetical protein